jgi:predicted nucleotidyltransferase
MKKNHPHKYDGNGCKRRRQDEANARQAEYDKLTPEQKLSKLTKHNLTAMKERAKLQKLIEANKAKKAEEAKPKAPEATSEAQKAAEKAKKAEKQKRKEAKDKAKAAKK